MIALYYLKSPFLREQANSRPKSVRWLKVASAQRTEVGFVVAKAGT